MIGQNPKRKNKKENSAYFKKIFVILILIFLFWVLLFSWKKLSGMDCFRIKDVFNKGGELKEFSYLKGRNIFSVDLDVEAESILRDFPECKKIRLIRIIPNRIFADFIKRRPVALIRLYKDFLVDEEAVVFPAFLSQDVSNLVLITGLEKDIKDIRGGEKSNNPRLFWVLYIIKKIRQDSILRDYKMRKINVDNVCSSGASIFFLLPIGTEKDIEVRVGQDKIGDKFVILSELFRQKRSELGKIEYIDLRFYDPVIKYKTEKKG